MHKSNTSSEAVQGETQSPQDFVLGLLKVVLSTIVDVEDAIEKGAEAGSEAGTDYLDPSLYIFEEEDGEGEEGHVGHRPEEENDGDDDDEEHYQAMPGPWRSVGSPHLGGVGSEMGVAGVRLSAKASPFMDAEAYYHGLANLDCTGDDAESEEEDEQVEGDPLCQTDLKVGYFKYLHCHYRYHVRHHYLLSHTTAPFSSGYAPCLVITCFNTSRYTLVRAPLHAHSLV